MAQAKPQEMNCSHSLWKEQQLNQEPTSHLRLQEAVNEGPTSSM